MEGDDPYQLLGVPRDAAIAEIRLRYLELIKLHHPDLAGRRDPGADHHAAAINAAFSRILSIRQSAEGGRVRRPKVAVRLSMAGEPDPQSNRARWIGLFLSVLVLAFTVTAAWRTMAPSSWQVRVDQLKLVTLAPGHQAGLQLEVVREATRMASSDLDWITIDTGPGGAERYSRRCFDQLRNEAAADLTLFCAAIDARAARMFARKSAYFALPLRIARLETEASSLPVPPRTLIHALDTEAARYQLPDDRGHTDLIDDAPPRLPSASGQIDGAY